MGTIATKTEASKSEQSKNPTPNENHNIRKISDSDNSTTDKIPKISAGSLWEDIRKYYKFQDVLGGGHFGSVRKAYKRQEEPRKYYAVKSIAKKNLSKDDLINLSREVEIISQLDHPNIIKFLETYQDKYYFHLVMELCEGKEVFEKIIQEGCLTELKVCQVLYKVLVAINYCHTIGISHRDIKPENILFQTADNDSEIKLIDFGLSKKYSLEEKMHTILGTPYYVAPEVLSGEYDQKCDIWSIGAIAHIMLTGQPPFNGKNNQEIFKKILTQEGKFEGEQWENLSEASIDFIKRCFIKCPDQRISASIALQHKWFDQIKNKQEHINSINQDILQNLKNFNQPKQFKKLVLRFLLNDISQIELHDLKEAFFAIDVKNQGFITMEQLETTFSKANIVFSKEELMKIFKRNEKDGKIDYSEFIIASSNLNNNVSREKLNLAFKYFDIDQNEIIDINDLRNCLLRNGKKIINQEELESIISEVAKNDHKISRQDFMGLFGYD